MAELIDQAKAVKVEPKSAIIDPYESTNFLSVRSKQSFISFQTLRRMARIPAIAAIINTRLNQVARFAKRPRYPGDTGFKIGLKDPNQKMTEAARKRAFELEEFFLRTGAIRNKRRKDNFNLFLRKIVRDSLELDALTWENVFNHKGELCELWAVDASTIELVTDCSTGELDPPPVYIPVTSRGQSIAGDIAYIQRINGQVVAEYSEEDLAYAVRNPRTDIERVGFGLSELEVLIDIVTGIVNGLRYNTSYFSHSHLPQGVMEIVGKYKDKHLEAFKRHWRTLTSGSVGKWAVPILALEDGQGFKFTPFKNSNKDMEFNQFLEFLFNLACAVYQINPDEVGFKSWSSGSSLHKTDNTSEKIEQSLDKGFVPLMEFLSDTFNSEVVDMIDPEFCFSWVGLSDQDEEHKWQQIKMKLDAGVVTVAEIRKQEDLPEIKDESGKLALWTQAPAHPQLIQVFMNELQQKQQKEMMEQQQQLDPATMQQGQQKPKMNSGQKDEPKKQELKKSLMDDINISINWADY